MLILNLERAIRMRGVKHPRAYLVNHGYSDGEARKLLNGKLKLVRLTLLTRLCETFNCTPNDLLDWNGDANHVLVGLSKDKAPDIVRLLEGKSPEELERIYEGLRGEDQ